MQKHEFTVGGEAVTLRRCGDVRHVVYLHEIQDDGDAVWRRCEELGCNDFALVAIRVPASKWNDILTPWECPGIFVDDAPFAGRAEEQLALLLDEIVPKTERLLAALLDGEEAGAKKPIPNGEECVHAGVIANCEAGEARRVLAGYSLAGLFATWAMFQTSAFSRIASASGSLWYPGFDDYAKTHSFAKQPECAYFSLGSKEARTPSRLLRRVAEGTDTMVSLFQERGVETVFEKNPGNHFKEPDLRMAKGIAWALQH